MPLCGVMTQSGQPCRWTAPCGVHTDAWLQRQALGREQRAMVAEDRRCDWPTSAGPCTAPRPCSYHARARERAARDARELAERAAREAAPKCGELCRSGESCKMPKPCSVHGEVAGMKQCSSTLDTDPFDRCRSKCEIGSLFCENHVAFPDLGRRARIYGDSCKRRRVDPTLAEFMAVAYPGATEKVAIHDIAVYVETHRVKMA
jgi:hypothetical protein